MTHVGRQLLRQIETVSRLSAGPNMPKNANIFIWVPSFRSVCIEPILKLYTIRGLMSEKQGERRVITVSFSFTWKFCFLTTMSNIKFNTELISHEIIVTFIMTILWPIKFVPLFLNKGVWNSTMSISDVFSALTGLNVSKNQPILLTKSGHFRAYYLKYTSHSFIKVIMLTKSLAKHRKECVTSNSLRKQNCTLGIYEESSIFQRDHIRKSYLYFRLTSLTIIFCCVILMSLVSIPRTDLESNIFNIFRLLPCQLSLPLY